MKVLVVEPFTPPYVKDIENSLEAMQQTVGGYIQCFCPFENDEIIILCDEEGKINGSLPNREILDKNGKRLDVIFGTFFIVREGEEDFQSLTDEQLKTYSEMFSLHKSKEKQAEKTKGESR